MRVWREFDVTTLFFTAIFAGELSIHTPKQYERGFMHIKEFFTFIKKRRGSSVLNCLQLFCLGAVYKAELLCLHTQKLCTFLQVTFGDIKQLKFYLVKSAVKLLILYIMLEKELLWSSIVLEKEIIFYTKRISQASENKQLFFFHWFLLLFSCNVIDQFSPKFQRFNI